MSDAELLETREPDKPSYTQLTFADQKLLRSLHEAGKTQVQIAQTLGCAQSTVSKWINTWYDSRDEARDILRTNAAKLATRIVKGKSEAVALQTLEDLEVIQKAQSNPASLKGQITVIVGAPESQVNVGIALVSPDQT